MRRIERIVLRHQIDAMTRRLLTAGGSPHARGLKLGSAKPWPPVLPLNNQTGEVRTYPSLDWYDENLR